MVFVEFLEAIGRAADKAAQQTPVIHPEALKNSKKFEIIGYLNDDSANLSLARKIENCMPYLLTACNKSAKENFNWNNTMPFFVSKENPLFQFSGTKKIST